MNCTGNPEVLYADTAIRIDIYNPEGVYFFRHALATYHHVHVVYLGNLQAEAC